MVTLLRTLTLKSEMRFGKYYDLTVGTILTRYKKHYLMWVYYNMSKITFTDDVLGSLGIIEKDRIEKPGANNKLGRIMVAKHKESWDEYTVKLIRNQIRLKAKEKLKGLKQDPKYTKGGLARYNQGHR